MDSGLKRKASSHGQRNKARDGMLTRDEVPAKLKRVVLQKEQNTAGSHVIPKFPTPLHHETN